MTKEQFLNGVSFKVKGFGEYKGACTFRLVEGHSIVEESRSYVDERVLLTSHLCNVTKIGTKGFEGFTFILSKKVKVKYRFEDLVEFEAEV